MVLSMVRLESVINEAILMKAQTETEKDRRAILSLTIESIILNDYALFKDNIGIQRFSPVDTMA